MADPDWIGRTPACDQVSSANSSHYLRDVCPVRCAPQYASPRLIRGAGERNRRIWVLRVIPYISRPFGEAFGSRAASTFLNPRHMRYPSTKTAKMNRYIASVAIKVTVDQ